MSITGGHGGVVGIALGRGSLVNRIIVTRIHQPQLERPPHPAHQVSRTVVTRALRVRTVPFIGKQLMRLRRKCQSVVMCISGIGKGSFRSGVRTFNLYSIPSSNQGGGTW
jgi:hypothetical protein